MQIDDDASIKSERADESVLSLQVRRFEGAAQTRKNEHDGRESERRPIVREQSPGGGCRCECTEIRMNGQQGTIRRAIE